MGWKLSAFADEAGASADEQVAALREAKINYIDLRNIDGVNIADLTPDHARGVQRKFEAAGIAVCMLASPIGKIDIADDFSIDLQRLRHMGELKKIFNTPIVRIFSYFNKGAMNEAAYQATVVERLHALIGLADKLDLVLYHENEVGIFGASLRHMQVLRDLVQRKRPDRFKLIFDFDNFNQVGEDPWDCWVGLRNDTQAIHLKESSRSPDGSFQHVPAGQGDGQIPRVLAELAASGWDGPLTLEPHLARSAAVLATGPHGSANAALADLSPAECFQIAARAARKLIADVGRLG